MKGKVANTLVNHSVVINVKVAQVLFLFSIGVHTEGVWNIEHLLQIVGLYLQVC